MKNRIQGLRTRRTGSRSTAGQRTRTKDSDVMEKCNRSRCHRWTLRAHCIQFFNVQRSGFRENMSFLAGQFHRCSAVGQEGIIY